MVTAGELRERITVYAREPIETDLGETDYAYVEQQRVHAKVTPVSGRSAALPGDAERVEVTHRVVIRESAIPHLATDMYFLCRGQRLDVLYWYPIYNQRGWMEIFCKMVIEYGT